MSLPPSSGHLDLDALADHLAGEVDATAHLSACAGCRARLAELEAAEGMVAAALRSLPEPTLPPDVADRLSAALAAEARPTRPAEAEAPTSTRAAATVTPLADRRRRTWLPSVAAAAVLVAGGLVGYSVLSGGSGTQDTTASPASDGAGSEAGAAAPTVTASGVDWADAPAVGAALPAVLSGTAGDPGAGASAKAPAPAAGALPADPLARLREPAALEDCLAALLDPAKPEERPLALDYATYAGSPALAVVLPDLDPARVSVFVVGPDCSRADDDLAFFTRLPKP